MSALRSVVVGTGFIGQVHIGALRRAGGELHGVVDATPEQAAAAADLFGAGRAYNDLSTAFNDPDVDVIHICTPNAVHASMAAGALAAGKHVICEKPLTVDVADAARLVKAMESAGVVATVPFIYRFYPTVREARRRIRDGSAGRLLLAHGSYLQDWLLPQDSYNWRADTTLGGASRAFADIGSHWCDLMQFVSGDRIVRLLARTTTAISRKQSADAGGNEDAAIVTFELASGAVGTVIVSQVSAGRKNRLWIELDCANQSFVFDQENPDSLWCGGMNANTIVPRGPETLSEYALVTNTLPSGHPQGYADAFTAFVVQTYDAIRSGTRPQDLPSFKDGLEAVRITDAVLRSAKTESWTLVDEVPDPRQPVRHGG